MKKTAGSLFGDYIMAPVWAAMEFGKPFITRRHYRKNRTERKHAVVIVIVYGNAITTIRKYERRINDATAEVSRKRKAA